MAIKYKTSTGEVVVLGTNQALLTPTLFPDNTSINLNDNDNLQIKPEYRQAILSEVDSKDAVLQTLINNIVAKIPTEATNINKLADKGFVLNAINNANGDYITSNASKSPFATKASLLSGPYYYNGIVATLKTNDYAIVSVDESKENKATKYMYSAGSWVYLYDLNNTGLTTQHALVLESGITPTLVSKITSNENAIITETTNRTNAINAINLSIAEKISKNETVTSLNQAYVKNASGTQTMQDIAAINPVPHSIVSRDSLGEVSVSDATKLNSAVNKRQLDLAYSAANNEYSLIRNEMEEIQNSLIDSDSNIQSQINVINEEIGTIEEDILSINEKIPASVTNENKLADREFVTSAVTGMLSRYITTSSRESFVNKESLINGPWYHGITLVLTPNNNDYAIVLNDEDHSGLTSRYVYTSNAWVYQYSINNTPMTQSQINAINSGITTSIVSMVQSHNTILNTIQSPEQIIQLTKWSQILSISSDGISSIQDLSQYSEFRFTIEERVLDGLKTKKFRNSVTLDSDRFANETEDMVDYAVLYKTAGGYATVKRSNDTELFVDGLGEATNITIYIEVKN